MDKHMRIDGGELILRRHAIMAIYARRELLVGFQHMAIEDVAARVLATGRRRLLLRVGQGWLVFQRNGVTLTAKTFLWRPHRNDRDDLFIDSTDGLTKVKAREGFGM